MQTELNNLPVITGQSLDTGESGGSTYQDNTSSGFQKPFIGGESGCTGKTTKETDGLAIRTAWKGITRRILASGKPFSLDTVKDLAKPHPELTPELLKRYWHTWTVTHLALNWIKHLGGGVFVAVRERNTTPPVRF